MKMPFLYPLACTLFFLPLSHAIGDYWHITQAWNDGLWLLLPFVAFYLYFFWQSPQRHLLTAALLKAFLGLIIALLVVFGSRASIHSLPEYIRLFFVFISIPLLVQLMHKAGWKKIACILVGIISLHSQWGWLQFASQHDLFLIPVGESHLSPSVVGVAKFASWHGKLIRPYGPYLHANPLAGMAVLGLTLSLLLFASKARTLAFVLASFFIFTIVISVSRAAAVSLLLLFIAFFLFKPVKISLSVNPSTLLLLICFFITISPFLLGRILDSEDRGLADRFQGLQWAVNLLSPQHIWQGVGPGQYSAYLQNYLTTHRIAYSPWEIAPLHSSLPLIIVEWGFLPIMAAFLWLFYQFEKKPRVERRGIYLYLLPLLPLLFLDHYFITQSAPLFFLILFCTLLSEIVSDGETVS